MLFAPFEQGEIGPDLYRKACEFSLEGLVSKHRDRPCRSGRLPHWIKVKDRTHAAMISDERCRLAEVLATTGTLELRGVD
jgi:ATP-dependent DNA ligase